MSLILSIETSTSVGSVALHRAGALVSLFDICLENSHSQTLTLQIDQAVTLAGFSLSQLDAVALSAGPGSYTGLRIGTATAKGLCFALDKPLIAVGTLEAMAHGFRQANIYNNALLCPLLDARRMEAWSALYAPNSLETIWEAAPRVLIAESFAEIPDHEQVICFGNGAAKYAPLLAHRPNFVFLNGLNPSAKSVGELAHVYWQQGRLADVAYFEPYYLKEGNVTAPKLS